MKRKPRYRPHATGPVLVLGLTALYLLFSVGVVKATHSCMGREASVAYFTAESQKCPCSKFAKGADHCCDDSRDLLKLDLTHKNVSIFQLSVPSLSLLGELHNLITVSRHPPLAIFRPDADDAQPPPRILYKIHCSFVFYDIESVA